MRINKFLSAMGYCSRREADRLIESGRVTVDGVRAELGTEVEPGMKVCVGGEPVGTTEDVAARKTVLIAVNKPRGVVCTTSDNDRAENIVELVDYPERIYRTGDLACYNAAGELCFASRRDFQIKHMGHRIELGEIEAALEKIQGIERVCCMYLRGKIVAFYIGTGEKKELAHQLSESLPQYMIPNAWVPCETFPLTKNAKTDRSALEQQYAGRRKRTT